MPGFGYLAGLRAELAATAESLDPVLARLKSARQEVTLLKPEVQAAVDPAPLAAYRQSISAVRSEVVTVVEASHQVTAAAREVEEHRNGLLDGSELLKKVLGEVTEAAQASTSIVDRLPEKTRSATSSAKNELGSVAAAAEAAEGLVRASSQRMAQQVAASAAGVKTELQTGIRTPVEQAAADVEKLQIQVAQLTFTTRIDGEDVPIRDAVTFLTGDLLKLYDALGPFLPRSREVINLLTELRVQLLRDELTIDQIVERLSGSYIGLAQQLAKLVRLVQSGKATVEQLLRAANDLQRLFPGGEAAALADEIVEALARGEFD
ncbi:MAG TPA: hypothetical protein VNJ70_17865 [Thermoanaerobaculia bacterium]|nr:hypothetical protein [Thermoanaerobaculia bacterium]